MTWPLFLVAIFLPTGMCWFSGTDYCKSLDSFVRFECEKGTNFSGGKSTQDWRFGASDMHTAHLKTNEQSELFFKLCLTSKTAISLNSFFLSNDGGADELSIYIDKKLLAIVSSEALGRGGSLWNVIKKAKIDVGNIITLDKGSYPVLITAKTDKYGVAADVMELKLSSLSGVFERGHCEKNLTATEMTGGAFQCMKTIPPFTEVKPWKLTPGSAKGRAVRKSYKVGCAEEDNVDIRIYQKNPKRFRIVATPPFHKNCTELDMKITDFRNCDEKHFKKFLWAIGKDDGKSDEFTTNGGKTLKNADTNEVGNAKKFTRSIDGSTGDLTITFMAKGTSYGVIDANVGAKLNVSFANVLQQGLRLRVFATGRDGEWEIGVQAVSKTKNAVFNIPDFFWKEGDGNEIRIEVEGQGKAEFDFIRLDKRKERGRTETPDVFKSKTHSVAANVVDFWWLAPDMMELTVTGGSKSSRPMKVTWFKIIKEIHTNHWGEFFVLYQDGNSRLLPLPDRGIDWWPFGSSVIIGRPISPPEAHRPFAPIKSVHLDAIAMKMDITYKSGDEISIKLDGGAIGKPATIESTSINIKSTKDYPILTLRSMYVRDGNSDTDSVVSDASPNKKYTVVDDFKTFEGNSFHFFKMCTSMHNTRSPDIHVDVSA